MRDYNIAASPLSFLSVLDIQMKEEVGEHGVLTITGYMLSE